MALLLFKDGTRSVFSTEEEARAQAAHDLATGAREPLEVRDDANETVLVSHADLTRKK